MGRRTTIYIDGFNLYYGSLKGTRLKWLNPKKLAGSLLHPTNDITSIKYFTAKISPTSGDPQAPSRQQIYLRALQTIGELEVVYGHFLSHTVKMREAKTGNLVEVIKTEEKGSDVNLASHLVNDAHLNAFDVAVVVSNDSDLKTPIEIVKNELNRPVGVLFPISNGRKKSVELKNACTFHKEIRKGALAAAQFAHTISDAAGTFSRPRSWT